jgi:hypothetical protein
LTNKSTVSEPKKREKRKKKKKKKRKTKITAKKRGEIRQ